MSAKPFLPHIWMDYPRISETAEVCRVCGVVRQRSGSTDSKSCRGPASVTLREALDVARAALSNAQGDA